MKTTYIQMLFQMFYYIGKTMFQTQICSLDSTPLYLIMTENNVVA